MSNKRILFEHQGIITKKGKNSQVGMNTISVPLTENERNGLYEQFESISDLVSAELVFSPTHLDWRSDRVNFKD